MTTDYELNLSWRDRESVARRQLAPISYDPTPPLDFDLSTIDGDHLRTYRTETMRIDDAHPSITEAAEAFGVSPEFWVGWEAEGVDPCGWAGVLREWFVEGPDSFTPTRAPVPAEHLRAVAELVGSLVELADYLGVSRETVWKWSSTDRTPSKGYAPLLHYTYDYLYLTPTATDELRRRLTESQRATIRKRARQGESSRTIADDYDVTDRTIRQIIRDA